MYFLFLSSHFKPCLCDYLNVVERLVTEREKTNLNQDHPGPGLRSRDLKLDLPQLKRLVSGSPAWFSDTIIILRLLFFPLLLLVVVSIGMLAGHTFRCCFESENWKKGKERRLVQWCLYSGGVFSSF